MQRATVTCATTIPCPRRTRAHLCSWGGPGSHSHHRPARPCPARPSPAPPGPLRVLSCRLPSEAQPQTAVIVWCQRRPASQHAAWWGERGPRGGSAVVQRSSRAGPPGPLHSRVLAHARRAAVTRSFWLCFRPQRDSRSGPHGHATRLKDVTACRQIRRRTEVPDTGCSGAHCGGSSLHP